MTESVELLALKVKYRTIQKLAGYARHSGYCDLVRFPMTDKDKVTCTCGLTKATDDFAAILARERTKAVDKVIASARHQVNSRYSTLEELETAVNVLDAIDDIRDHPGD